MSSNRIEYFDFLRGIAIIFVVAIHSFTPFSISESNTLNYHLAIIWRQIIGCAVPIFLAISGYFMSNKDINTHSKIWLIYKKTDSQSIYTNVSLVNSISRLFIF
jgi:surface polysaccharide O-acyltransferase-like enzyme